MQTGLEISRVDHPVDCPELLVSGRMDGYWSRHLEEALNEMMREGIHRVKVNLSQTTYISSAGIRVLVHAFKEFSAVGGSILVVEPSAPVQKVLDLAGLGQMLCMPAAAGEVAAAPVPVSRYEEGECSFDLHECHAGAQLACRVTGRPERLASGALNRDDAMLLALPPDVFALGLGAFGDSYEACSDRFGEFPAVALFLPGPRPPPVGSDRCWCGRPGPGPGIAYILVEAASPTSSGILNFCRFLVFSCP
jgi:anti-anti-sigma factor